MSLIERQIAIDAPRSEVWAVVSDLEGAPSWNPSILEARCQQLKSGLGAKRTCRLKPSGHIEETVTDWIEGKRIEMAIEHAGGVRSARMAIELKDDGTWTSVVTTTEYEPAFGPLGLVMDRLVLYRSMRQMMDRSLAGLKDHVEGNSTRLQGEQDGNHL